MSTAPFIFNFFYENKNNMICLPKNESCSASQTLFCADRVGFYSDFRLFIIICFNLAKFSTFAPYNPHNTLGLE